ncbi:hypothetical protein GQS40_12360|uniref:Uncharacterized protein n=2 Tax=Leuconostoc lactis TaxID=1246 RepID=A0A6L7A7X7_LEULA|nr:hypothetical protein [Leuconostoc lactis]
MIQAILQDQTATAKMLYSKLIELVYFIQPADQWLSYEKLLYHDFDHFEKAILVTNAVRNFPKAQAALTQRLADSHDVAPYLTNFLVEMQYKMLMAALQQQDMTTSMQLVTQITTVSTDAMAWHEVHDYAPLVQVLRQIQQTVDYDEERAQIQPLLPLITGILCASTYRTATELALFLVVIPHLTYDQLQIYLNGAGDLGMTRLLSILNVLHVNLTDFLMYARVLQEEACQTIGKKPTQQGLSRSEQLQIAAQVATRWLNLFDTFLASRYTCINARGPLGRGTMTMLESQYYNQALKFFVHEKRVPVKRILTEANISRSRFYDVPFTVVTQLTITTN